MPDSERRERVLPAGAVLLEGMFAGDNPVAPVVLDCVTVLALPIEALEICDGGAC